MSIFRLGILTSLMSRSLVVGFTMSAAVTIITSQLSPLTGIRIAPYTGVGKVPMVWFQILKNISEANAASVIITVICLFILIVIKEGINEKCKARMAIPIPAELIIVVCATILSYFLNLNEKHDVVIVGPLSTGFPAPSVPDISRVNSFIFEIFIIAIIGFVVTFTMADTFSRKHNYTVSVNQELFALGMCNTVPAFMSGFVGCAAPPRCSLLSTQGSRTQVSGVTTCTILFLVILFLGKYFEHLPNAALSTIIVVALFPMLRQHLQVKQFWNINKPDFAIWLVTFSSVIFLNLDIGLIVGIIFSILVLILNSCMTPGILLYSAQSIDLLRDDKRYSNLTNRQDIKVFKHEAGLYFAVAQVFKSQLFKSIGSPTDLKSSSLETKEKCNFLIIDCSCISYIDVVGINLLNQLNNDYETVGIEMMLAACPQSMLQKLHNAGMISDEAHSLTIFPTIQDAIANIEHDQVTV